MLYKHIPRSAAEGMVWETLDAYWMVRVGVDPPSITEDVIGATDRIIDSHPPPETLIAIRDLLVALHEIASDRW
jgi:hypothetical protein